MCCFFVGQLWYLKFGSHKVATPSVIVEELPGIARAVNKYSRSPTVPVGGWVVGGSDEVSIELQLYFS
jgi:hypothetical protein